MDRYNRLDLSQDIVDQLQTLIQVNIDSQEGLTEAADKVDDDRLSGTFRQVAQSRAEHARALQSAVAANDQAPAAKGTATGAIHRGWTSMRSAINGGDAYVMLIEAERGEDRIKSEYEQTLRDTAGSSVHELLQSQYIEVKQGHDLIRDLRDSYAER